MDYKHCASCGLDKWLDEFSPSGYCRDCKRVKGRIGAAKWRRRVGRAYHNAYMREYRQRRKDEGRPLS